MNNEEFLDRYGPVALVTGASSGIGKAFAGLLAQRGLALVLVARRADRLQALSAELRDTHGTGVNIIQADVGDLDDLQRILAQTAALDVGLVISNAGFSIKGEYAAMDARRMTEMLRVNCQAPLLLAHGFVPRLKARGKGGLIFTSSVEALIGCPFSTAYSATKALVKNLGEGLWGELTPLGIDVLTLCPGATDTEALAGSGVDVSRMEHVMSPVDVARLTLENIRNGPVFISSEHYRKLFEQLTAMPRREALLAMARSMQGQAGQAE